MAPHSSSYSNAAKWIRTCHLAGRVFLRCSVLSLSPILLLFFQGLWPPLTKRTLRRPIITRKRSFGVFLLYEGLWLSSSSPRTRLYSPPALSTLKPLVFHRRYWLEHSACTPTRRLGLVAAFLRFGTVSLNCWTVHAWNPPANGFDRFDLYGSTGVI